MPGWVVSIHRDDFQTDPRPDPGRGSVAGRSPDREPSPQGVPNMTEGAPLLELRGVSKVFGAVQGAQRRRLRRGGGQGHRPGRRQRRRQVVVDQDRVGAVGPDRGADPLGGPSGSLSQPERCRGRRDHHDLPGPGAVRQPRHRAEHVPRPRDAAPRPARRERHGARGAQDPGRPPRDDRPLHPPARRVALRRPAPIRRRGQGGDVGRQAGDHGRAHRRPRRGADAAWCSTSSSACRARAPR